MPEPFRSGLVSILGRPNAGKSTLLNTLLGGKLAIVSDKPQTTRTSIEGVLHLDNAQVVFLDTPGIHKSTTLLNKRMMDTVRSSVADRDLLLYLADATASFTDEDVHALAALSKEAAPVFLLLTKVDRLSDKRLLLPQIEHYKAIREFDEYFPISSVTGEGLDALRAAILARLPEGPSYYPPDYITDQPERFLAAELIREQILRLTRQEVPHSVAVLVDKWEVKPALTRVFATIFVERQGQKAIVIGAKGSTLKEIGTRARQQMEKLLGRKVFLQLFVKVEKDWRERAEFLNSIDWRTIRSTESD
ncbi:MAG TPA: GTPase Era [Bryobacteraceae bacterium]|nr:GTPase Era [Bryobacteraceae bacterium]